MNSWIRVAVLTVAVGIALLSVAEPAHAATGVSANPGLGVLTVSAASGRSNVIVVERQGGDFVVRDFGDTVSAGTGCMPVSATTVRCSATGIFRISVSAGDLNDTITKTTSTPGSLIGGTGNDTIHAGPAVGGGNNLFGGIGNDTLVGGANSDFLDGGSGADALRGGAGSADLADYRARTTPVTVDIDGVADDGGPGEGDNVATDVENISGGSAGDFLVGNNDFLGTGGSNRLNGLAGNDVLNGLGGADQLSGDGGDDTLIGGAGGDTALAGPSGDGADSFNGGVDVDTVSYQLRGTALNVSLDGVANDGEAGEGDNNVAVEGVVGGAAADLLSGSAAANLLSGGFGGDTLRGSAGDDTLRGNQGNDTLDGEGGSDFLDGGDGNDLQRGGVGNDRLDAGPGPVSDPDGTVPDGDRLDGGAGFLDSVHYSTRTAQVTVDLDNMARAPA